MLLCSGVYLLLINLHWRGNFGYEGNFSLLGFTLMYDNNEVRVGSEDRYVN